jgi:N-acetylglucosaminyldiphosphoundecaprenol N-acetyl-beta-D-mannosaminyltransferase
VSSSERHRNIASYGLITRVVDMAVSRRSCDLLGIRIGNYDLEGLLAVATDTIEQRGRMPFTFACANPHSLVIAKSDVAFRFALQSCSAVVADGVGLTLAGRIVGADVGPRITGTDFFIGMMSALNRRGGRVFFLGSTDAVLSRIRSFAQTDFPNVHLDMLSPPFGDWDDRANLQLLAQINAARPDILWIGMTAPKQEKWMRANLDHLDVPVIGAVGAVFDYYAKTVIRAPEWLCRFGLEWLYRLSREPRRLWKRTVISAPMFLWLIARERWVQVRRSQY